ncbi:MAG TPA: hypothetical protein VGO22_20910 [Pseudorhizobium sp.]|jgi:diacylglycerol kinase (ATP)|nr:hypothetical protein [Pseudorhizobium sp.]
MTVHSDATAQDGMLDFYSLAVDHLWKLLTLLPSLRKGSQGNWTGVQGFSNEGSDDYDKQAPRRQPR